METKIIDRLFLKLSQVTKATTKKEIKLSKMINSDVTVIGNLVLNEGGGIFSKISPRLIRDSSINKMVKYKFEITDSHSAVSEVEITIRPIP